MASFEYATLTEANFAVIAHAPAVAVEYDIPDVEPDELHYSLSFAMRALALVIDADLRKPEKRSASDTKWWQIMNDARRSFSQPAPEDTYYETINPEGLHELGEQLAHELTHHYRGPMPHAPASSHASSGYNAFGDVIISRGFDNYSPQATNIYDSHWFKRFLSMCKVGDNMLAVGMYAPSDGPQYLEADALKRELEQPGLADLLLAPPKRTYKRRPTKHYI